MPDVFWVVASALEEADGPLATHSFYTLPIYCLLSVSPPSSYCPCPGDSTCHLSPGLSWLLSLALWPPLPPAIFHMLLPLSICPQIKTLHWVFIAYRRKSKLLNMVYRSFRTRGLLSSFPLSRDTPSSHFSPSKKHWPNYWCWFRCQHLAHVGLSTLEN